jgi:F-type H+-transporting ATPase subunit b
MTHMMDDPLFFYAISFAIFMALAWWKGRRPLLAWIDSEIIRISEELKQAAKLRAEAETMLADAKARQAAAASDAETMMRRAEQDAKAMCDQVKVDLQSQMAKHAQQLADRIRITENEASDIVRTAAIDMAVAMAEDSLRKRIDGATASKLIDQALSALPAMSAPAKAKAA